MVVNVKSAALGSLFGVCAGAIGYSLIGKTSQPSEHSSKLDASIEMVRNCAAGGIDCYYRPSDVAEVAQDPPELGRLKGCGEAIDAVLIIPAQDSWEFVVRCKAESLQVEYRVTLPGSSNSNSSVGYAVLKGASRDPGIGNMTSATGLTELN